MINNRKIIITILLIVVFLFFSGRPNCEPLKLITHTSDERHTAVTIEINSPVEFSEHYLSNPDRLYIDIKQSNISPATKTYQINSTTLNTVRLGKFDKQTLRIVFDLGKMFDTYNISTLRAPYRIIANIYAKKAPSDPTTNKSAIVMPIANVSQMSALKTKAADNTEQLLSEILFGEKNKSVFFNKGLEKKISLKDTFLEALQRNLSIKSARLTPVSAGLDISSSKAAFYPTFTQGFSVSGNPVLRTSGVSTPTGLSLPLLTGGSLSLSYTTLASLAQDTATKYQSTLAALLNMPLLAGAGYFANWAPVIIAEINELNSRTALREQIETIFVNVNTAYWNLLLAKEGLAIQLDAYDDAKKLHNKTLELIKEGEVAELDKYQTDAAISSRSEAVIVAVKSLRTAQDTLLNLLSRDLSENISPEDQPIFDYIDPDYQNSLSAAFENRTDYLQALENIKISEINLKVAKNSSLPNLSLNFGYNTGSSLDTGGLGRSMMHGADERSWSASLNYTVPIPNTIKKNTYLKSKITLDQANISLDNLKETIKREIRGNIVAVLSSKKKVEIAKKTKELNQMKLNSENAKLEEGLSDLFTVISYQNDLVTAQLSYISAVVEYQNAIIALKKGEGVLSSFLNINIHDAAIGELINDFSDD